MIVGVDLGGTSFKIGFYENNKIVDFIKVSTEREKGYLYVIDKICSSILKHSGNVESVGIGLPGSVDPKNGIIRYSPNFPGWLDMPIVKDLKNLLHCDIFVENDANVFALGERYFGAAKNIDNFVAITIGTGIGGGIFVDGRLLTGENGFAGEIGHMKITMDGPLCGCGKRGCFEAWCSSENIKNRYNELFNLSLSTEEILKKDDLNSLKFLDETFKIMGIAISNLVNIFNPSKIILGGGLTKSASLFVDKVRFYTESFILNSFRNSYQIEISTLSENSAVLGAISLVLYNI